MFSRISRNSNRILAILSQHRKPTQIASGIAIGIMLGLIPKDNLVALSLVVFLASLRVNQLAACGAAVSISLMSGWISTITIYTGSVLLDQPVVASGIVNLYRLPVLPWTCLENSLVLGGIAIGLATLLPSYTICWWSLTKAKQKLGRIEMEHIANGAIQYGKSVADQSSMRREKLPPSLRLISADNAVAYERKANTYAEPTSVSSNLVEKAVVDSSSKVHPFGVESIVAKLPNTEAFQWRNRNRKQNVIPTLFTGEIIPDGNDTILRETVIEVVRYRRPSSTTQETNSNKPDSAVAPKTQGISMPIGNAATTETKEIANIGVAASSKNGLAGQSIVFDSSHAPSHTSSRDESLKYLLWHINGSRESVRKSSEKTA